MEYFYCDSEGQLIPCSMQEWASCLDMGQHVLFKTPIADGYVSTVCLGFNHGFFGPPLYFETMAFDISGIGLDEGGDIQARYATYEEAKAGHDKIVEYVRSLIVTN